MPGRHHLRAAINGRLRHNFVIKLQAVYETACPPLLAQGSLRLMGEVSTVVVPVNAYRQSKWVIVGTGSIEGRPVGLCLVPADDDSMQAPTNYLHHSLEGVDDPLHPMVSVALAALIRKMHVLVFEYENPDMPTAEAIITSGEPFELQTWHLPLLQGILALLQKHKYN